MLRTVQYALEVALLKFVLFVFRSLSLDRASALAGWIGRTVGPLTGKQKVAQENMRRALPEMGEGERARAILSMWDNLGRVVGELAHLERFYQEGRVEVVGSEHILALHEKGIGGIVFSAHMGNWELSTVALAFNGIPPVVIYRPANNQWSEQVIQRIRLKAHDLDGTEYVAKYADGMRRLVRALGSKRWIAMLADQKLNEGLPVPFFGRDAMTAPAIARMALRFGVPLVPARMERLEGARFRLTVESPMTLPETGDTDADVMTILTEINAKFEGWIRERPDQWLWIHRRWPREPDAKYR